MRRCAKPLPTAAGVHPIAPPRHLGAEVILRCRRCVVSYHRRRDFWALSRFESLRGSTRARTARCRQPRASSESNYETGPQSHESKPDGAGEPSPEPNQVPPMPESRRQLFRAGLVASTVVWVVGTSFVIKYLFFPGGMPLTAPVPVRTQLQQNARRSGRVADALPSPLVLRNPAATPTDAERPNVPEQPQTGSQRLASIASTAMRAMNMIRITAAATIAYRCQQLILANIFLKCLAVLVLALPYIAVGGYFYRKATGSSWALSMYKSYQTLYKTPSVVNKEKGASALVLNTIFIYGIFTFAILLGIVTDEIKQQVKAVRSGNYAVLEKDHIVILNWNKNTLPLVRQIALAKQERVHPIYQRPIVVLADRPKAEMDAGLYDALSRLAMPVQVMARQGVPHNTADLKRVAAHHAGIIIVQHPVEVPGGVRNEEKTKAAAAACLHSLVADSAKRPPTVILQMPCAIPEESQFVKVFTKATSRTGVRSTLVSLHDEELMDRIMSQAATQPGLATVYASLLQNGTNPTHLHFRSYPELEGQRFGHIRRRFPNAVVIGLYHPADERVELNPQDGMVPEKGCVLLLLSADERLRPVAKPLVDADIVATSRLEVAGVHHFPKKRSVIVAGWNKDPTSLVEGFSEFSPPGSEVVIISRNDLTADLPRSSGNVMRFHHLRASTSSSRRALLSAGLDKAQAVIVGANRDLDDSNGQSDAHVLSMIMMIQDQINEMGRSIPLHVVGCVRNPETVEVARHIISHLCPRKSEEALLTLELLLPADFTTGLLTQVAAEPRFANVLRELMTSQEGQEIYLKSPGRYALYDINRQVTFAEVQERVRQRGELALGWIEGEELKLAPCCSETVSFKPGDKVVVLAESWL